MVYIFGTLIIIAIILFILSFFMNDKYDELEGEIEQLSIQATQDTYQLKKMIADVESKLNESTIDTKTKVDQSKDTVAEIPSSLENKPLLIQKIQHLNEQGYSVEDIAKQTQLTVHDIQTVLKK